MQTNKTPSAGVLQAATSWQNRTEQPVQTDRAGLQGIYKSATFAKSDRR
jgi:hypothetical protein